MHKTLSAALAALCFAVPALAHADTPNDIRSQITAANNRFGPAVLRHDAATIAADYFSDGVFIVKNGPVIRGRKAVQQFYAQRMDTLSRYVISCATQRLAYDGTAVLEEGTCTFAPRDKTMKTPKPAHYLTIWKKDSDGRWRIAVNT